MDTAHKQLVKQHGSVQLTFLTCFLLAKDTLVGVLWGLLPAGAPLAGVFPGVCRLLPSPARFVLSTSTSTLHARQTFFVRLTEVGANACTPVLLTQR